MSAAIYKKLVIVGDAGCGKTCLLIAFTEEEIPSVHNTTIFDNYVMKIETKGKLVQLHLWDTAGLEYYDRLRPLAYPDTDVVLVCFAVDSHASLNNIPERWIPEVKKFPPGVPVIFVACKIDLRSDPHTIKLLRREGERPVTAAEGWAMAEQAGALCYLECSAKTGEGVKKVAKNAARAALKYKIGIVGRLRSAKVKKTGKVLFLILV